MNLKVTELTLGVCVCLTASAWAAISPGDGAAGNPPGELFVTVWDAANQVSYTRDLGIPITDFLANPNQTISISPDPLYDATFDGVDPATLVYSIGAFNNRFDDFPCCYGMVISSNNATSQVFLPDFTALNTSLTVGSFYVRGANANDGGGLTDYGAHLPSTSLPGQPGYYDEENWGGNIGLTVPFQTGAPLGTPLAFHSLLLDELGVDVHRTTFTNLWTLAADGTLTYEPPVPADSDADGVPDDADNCTLVENADQRDTDEDGFGNICDGDFNGDCTTDGIDWAFMRRVFHSQNRRADLNGDGTVNAEDAMLILAMREQPPGPSGVATCGAL